MKGDPDAIQALGDVLAAELAAINQYFLHYKMCEHWGYGKLAHKKREESIEEMKDAEAITARILFLDGIPNMQRMNPVKVGEDPIEQHRCDLAIELEAVARLNKAIALCVAKNDNGTREMLEGILKGEEAVDRLARVAAAPGRGDRQGALPRRANRLMPRCRGAADPRLPLLAGGARGCCSAGFAAQLAGGFAAVLLLAAFLQGARGARRRSSSTRRW